MSHALPTKLSARMASVPDTAQEPHDPEVAGVAWDLEPLARGEGEAGVRALLDEATARAEVFAATHAGEVAELDAGGLRAAMEELAALHELVGRAGSYASLHFAVDTADPSHGALLQLVQERGTAIQTTLLFFELEWAALDDAQAEALLADPGLAFCAHHLRSERRYRPYLLSEPEERILNEKAISARSAWTRLYRGADVIARGHAAGRARAGLARAGARAALGPRPPESGAPPPKRSRRRSRRACARAPRSTTRCCTTSRSTTACAATPTGSQRATSRTRRATSRSRHS